MYAIIRQGNHQYRVSPGDVIQLEKVEAEAGAELSLDDVLLLHDGENLSIGAPLVEGASLSARVLRNGRGKKVIVFKKKRRKGYTKKQGHRQSFTEVKITGITHNGQQLASI